MNISHILRAVKAGAPEATDCRIEDQGSTFALFATIRGMVRCVQFTSAGIYGEGSYPYFGVVLLQSDEAIAAQLVGALKA